MEKDTERKRNIQTEKDRLLKDREKERQVKDRDR